MEEENNSNKHTRRTRYKGKNPKNFHEKYKELQPERYSEDVEKIKEKGRTPAGMHISICVNEIMEFLNIQSGQVGMDATLGYGGHSLEILKRLHPGGLLYATDVDPIELPRTVTRLQALGYGEDKFIAQQMNFAGIDRIVEDAGPLDFVMADLGLSSMQIDNPERGFSLKTEGPLDLRMNPQNGKSAALLLKKISKEKLEELLTLNSDEPHAKLIATAISVALAGGKEIATTTQLTSLIEDCLLSARPNLTKDDLKKSCQRCFQALRIEVNKEFEVLDAFLDKLPGALKPGGRVAILSFHSGEDRRVKKSFQEFFRLGLYEEITQEPIRATPEESFNNRRARSAKLRWAIRAAD